MNSDRRAIFSKIQNALSRGREKNYLQDTALPQVDPSLLPGDRMSEDEQWERFADQIVLLGDTCERVDSKQAAQQRILACIQESGYTRAVCDQDAAEYLELDLQDYGPELGDTSDVNAVLAAQVGITRADFAIAESGTLGLCVQEKRSRMTSLAPDMHIALLDLMDMVAGPYEAIRMHKQKCPDRSIVWITGSSRTADIDGILIHGAHGPRQLHVLGVAS